MIKNYETVDLHELEEIKGGFLPGALAIAWGLDCIPFLIK